MREKLNSGLNEKVMDDIYDMELADAKCNCNVASLCEDGKCLYEGKCRRSMIVTNCIRG